MKTRTQQNKTAFTLIELLVVISIILILVALLLPALESVQQKVDTVVCLNNLRQLALAMNTYQADYRGEWPATYSANCAAGWVDSPGAATPTVYWDDPSRVTRGVLYPYVNNLK